MSAVLGAPSTFVLAFARPFRMHEPAPTADDAEARSQQLAQWLRAAAGGDGRAFEQFYNATARHTLAVVRRIVGDAYAEDVLAECYFQAWRNAAQFDEGRGAPLAWLMTLARSRALDRLRQEQLRHGGATGAPEFDADAHEAPCAPGPDVLLESVQARTRLHAALGDLSAHERWVLGLAYFRELSQSEIAARTGLPLGTVKSLMTRGQHKLREALRVGVAHG